MTTDPTNVRERWAIVSAILDGAFECSAQELDASLDAAYGGDRKLRREVEQLLHAETLTLLAHNALQLVTRRRG